MSSRRGGYRAANARYRAVVGPAPVPEAPEPNDASLHVAKIGSSVVHLGRVSKTWAGYIVSACDGRTMKGTPTTSDVTCKRCTKLAAARDNAITEGRNYRLIVNDRGYFECYLKNERAEWCYVGSYEDGLEAHAVGQRFVQGAAMDLIQTAASLGEIFTADELESFADEYRARRAAQRPSDPKYARR